MSSLNSSEVSCLQQTVTSLNSLNHIVKELSSALDFNVQFSHSLYRMATLLGAERLTFFLLKAEPDGEQKLVAKRGESRGMQRSFGDWLSGHQPVEELPFGEADEFVIPIVGIAGEVVKTGKSIFVHNVAEDQRHFKGLSDDTNLRTRNMLAVPVLASQFQDESVLGVLQAINKNELLGRGFNKNDEQILSAFAAHLATFVSNAQLYSTAKNAAMQSRSLLKVSRALGQQLKIGPLAHVIVTEVQQLLNSERATLFVVDGTDLFTTSAMSCGVGMELPIKRDVEDKIRFPKSSGLVGVAVMEKRCFVVDDAYKDDRFNRKMDRLTGFRTKSVMCMPIMDNDGDVVAVIQVINKLSEKNTVINFSGEDVSLVRAFASQTAVAIGNCNLFEATEKALNSAYLQIRELKFLLSVTHGMGARSGNILQVMLSQLKDLVKADHYRLFLVDDSSPGYFYDVNDQSRLSFSLAKGIAGHCIGERREIVCERDAQRHACFDPEVDSIQGAALDNFAIVPITIPRSTDVEEGDSEGDSEHSDEPAKCVGAIALQNETHKKKLTLPDIKLLRAFCTQAGLSLSRSEQIARVLKETQEQARPIDRSAASYLRQKHQMNVHNVGVSSFQINISDLEFIEVIGEGSYGSVWKARLTSEPDKFVAVKRLFTQVSSVEAFCSEGALQMQLDHPNIVKLRGVVTDPSQLSIITEFCERGSVADFLISGRRLPLRRRKQIVYEIAQAMEFLHFQCNPPILHRDLKSDNILLAKDWTAKVSDFGLSRFFQSRRGRRMTQVGTPIFMAPEVLLGENYDEKSDVFSFAIVMYEILCELEPYEELELMQVVVQVVNENLRPDIPPVLEDDPAFIEYIKLMRECWHKLPSQRPDFAAIVRRLDRIRAKEPSS
ncbi:MAG: hypothetical protein MHM6MM_006119 [Cercozoa sp. M6MM]